MHQRERLPNRLRMSSSDTASRFLATYREGPRHTAEVARSFREVVMSKIGRLVPRTATQIMQDVDSEWGCTNIRRIYNALSRLIKDGKVRRLSEGYVLRKVR